MREEVFDRLYRRIAPSSDRGADSARAEQATGFHLARGQLDSGSARPAGLRCDAPPIAAGSMFRLAERADGIDQIEGVAGL